ncbi:hypothetical protein DNHGIG_22600 [Collibacillus ludicampi]|uniref:EAL domain-containing protein n=1 Tax=Collibacillus ludicampi TaxID=2771369 RepID=A0AAV4LFV2_9BACL|nr:EAL domain-containing protein [Collibacillus ludicampi]GIM46711.1 hypothetical protein DNHGIG_22600 [Collibacillus ludicampi]
MSSIMWNGFRDFAWKLFNHITDDLHLGVIYIDLMGFSQLERTYGMSSAQKILQLTRHHLQQVTGVFAERNGLKASSYYVWDDCFAVLLTCSQAGRLSALSHLAAKIVYELEQELAKRKRELPIVQELCFRVGIQVFQRGEEEDLEQVSLRFYEAFVRASRQAKQAAGAVPYFDIIEFEQILQEKSVTSLFQPIVDLKDGTVFGWEALSRGPEGSRLHSPARLFATAEKLGQLFVLERICRESGIKSFGKEINKNPLFPPDDRPHLFINVHPQTIHDPNFISGQTMKMVQRNGLQPSQIVIEITEHQAIQDYPTFLESINHYRQQGYRIAIDDTGAGYAGLQTIVELMPDFIKLDMHLVRHVDRDERKRIMGETIVNLANKLGAQVIAEGIETPEELEMMKSLGAHYGQGYLWGKPDSVIDPFCAWTSPAVRLERCSLFQSLKEYHL